MAKSYTANINMSVYGAADDGEEYCHEIFLTKGSYDINLEADDTDVDLDLYIADNEGNILFEDESEDSDVSVEVEIYNEGVLRFYVKAFGDTKYTINISEQD
ncbi:hypothetical protein [Neptuniibacter sp.]|uniref:hypothetical protein n=1 Tax=Neptuniibacter sp. TaxID=1962643 RepID=UPI00260D3973|nr:hypothetical protein [Neptuniibacter sp.]MCP4598642.1 hypothetical protein [Neptuniibacter sp.]